MPWINQPTRKKGLLWLTVLQVPIDDKLAPLFGAVAVRSITTGMCGTGRRVSLTYLNRIQRDGKAVL